MNNLCCFVAERSGGKKIVLRVSVGFYRIFYLKRVCLEFEKLTFAKPLPLCFVFVDLLSLLSRSVC